jgi:hypothetical protein
VPNFVVIGSRGQKSRKPGRGLRGFVHTVTLLNTDSNLINTGRGLARKEEEGKEMLPALTALQDFRAGVTG